MSGMKKLVEEYQELLQNLESKLIFLKKENDHQSSRLAQEANRLKALIEEKGQLEQKILEVEKKLRDLENSKAKEISLLKSESEILVNKITF